MAAIVTDALETLLAGLEGTGAATGVVGTAGLQSLVIRGVAGGLIGFGASQILNAFIHHPSAKSKLPGTKYAIVDMHSDTVIRFISRQALYRLLTRKRRRFGSRSRKIVVAPAGSEVIHA